MSREFDNSSCLPWFACDIKYIINIEFVTTKFLVTKRGTGIVKFILKKESINFVFKYKLLNVVVIVIEEQTHLHKIYLYFDIISSYLFNNTTEHKV